MKIVVMPARTRENPGDDAMLSNITRYLKGLSNEISITLVSIFDEADPRYMEESFEGEFQDSLYNRVPAFWGAIPTHYGKLRSHISFLRIFIQTTIVLLMAKIGRHTLRFTPQGRMRPALEAIVNANLIVVWNGLNCDPGLKNKLRFWKSLYPAALAALLRVPVVRFPQTIGPFASKLDATLARWVLNSATFIMVREKKSLKILKDLHIAKPQIFAVPDMAFFGIEKENIWASDESSNIASSPHKVTIGITIRPWSFPGRKNSSVLYNHYITAIEEAIVKLSKHFLAHFLIIQQASGPGQLEDDWPASELIYKRLDEKGVDVQIVPMQNSLKDHVALYRRLSVLIATRMHSTIFSMGWGVPSVMIASRPHRDYGIMEMMGIERYVFPIDHLVATDIYQSVVEILSDKDIPQKMLTNHQKMLGDLSKGLKHFEEALAKFLI